MKKFHMKKIFSKNAKLRIPIVSGFDIRKAMDIHGFVNELASVGFQASNVAKASNIIKEMKKERVFVILTFTSNMVSSGLRELFAELCRRKFIDMIITGVGSVEEDIMKSFSKFYLGSFDISDTELHKKGINRIGNIFVPNEAYIKLERFVLKVFEKMCKKKNVFSPSELIFELGKDMKDKHSFVYWCTRNNIPIHCPAITDGAIGLQIYFFKQLHNDFVIDVTKDMNDLANCIINAEKTGGIILGGGFAKHHAIGINIIKGGFDYCVYITTGVEYDGSVSGARTKEAISWGKINEKATHITVHGDATILFPLIITPLLK